MPGDTIGAAASAIGHTAQAAGVPCHCGQSCCGLNCQNQTARELSYTEAACLKRWTPMILSPGKQPARSSSVAQLHCLQGVTDRTITCGKTLVGEVDHLVPQCRLNAWVCMCLIPNIKSLDVTSTSRWNAAPKHAGSHHESLPDASWHMCKWTNWHVWLGRWLGFFTGNSLGDGDECFLACLCTYRMNMCTRRHGPQRSVGAERNMTTVSGLMSPRFWGRHLTSWGQKMRNWRNTAGQTGSSPC